MVINGTCLDFLAESFMAGDPLAGGGFVILNGVEFDGDGRIVPQASPYPGSNLFSLASGGAIYLRDPYLKVVDGQLNGGVFSPLTDKDWRLIRALSGGERAAVRHRGGGLAHCRWRATQPARRIPQGQRREAVGAGRVGGEEMTPVTTSTAPAAIAGGTRVTIEIEEIGGGLAGEVRAASGASPMSCYQCAKCSSGCPVADRGDLKPHELVRLVQTDQRGAVLASRFIWECTSCHTCITRCPQNVDIPAMNDALRMLSIREGMAVTGTAVPAFNKVFLNSVRKRGRVHELGLMVAFKLRTRRFFEDVDKAPEHVGQRQATPVGSPGRRSERPRGAVPQSCGAAAAEQDGES